MLISSIQVFEAFYANEYNFLVFAITRFLDV